MTLQEKYPHKSSLSSSQTTNTAISASSSKSDLSRKRSRGSLSVGAVCAALLVSACGIISTNILDKTFSLSAQKFSMDFGATTGKVPTVTCASAGDSACATLGSQVSAAGGSATGMCDTSTKACYANISVTKSYPVSLSNDASFAQTVGSRAISVVKAIELNYSANNGSTVNLPDMNLYIGPETAKNVTDKDVVLIDKIPGIPKGTSVPSGTRKIVVPSGTPAFERFSYYLQNPKVSFLLLMTATPTVRAGEDLPKGQVEISVTPAFTVGLPL